MYVYMYVHTYLHIIYDCIMTWSGMKILLSYFI